MRTFVVPLWSRSTILLATTQKSLKFHCFESVQMRMESIQNYNQFKIEKTLSLLVQQNHFIKLIKIYPVFGQFQATRARPQWFETKTETGAKEPRLRPVRKNQDQDRDHKKSFSKPVLRTRSVSRHTPLLNKYMPKLGKHAINWQKQGNDAIKSICWRKVAKFGHDTKRARKIFPQKMIILNQRWSFDIILKYAPIISFYL